MTKSHLPDLRRLAANNQIGYTDHAFDQMLDREVTEEEVKQILSSPTNQLIEVQSPSKAKGKSHRHERDLISDPEDGTGIIVVVVVQVVPKPGLVVVTVEYAEDDKWIKSPDDDPWLVRKR